MSRAYRIKVSEQENRVIRAEDHVSTALELLEILPGERMAELLKRELEKRGFQESDGEMIREQDGLIVAVDPRTAQVTVSKESSQEVELKGEKQGSGYDDVGASRQEIERRLKEELSRELDTEATRKTADLQKSVTDELEAALGDLRKELNEAVNRVTADALKEKAAQLGQIKEMTEDPQTGSMTIVVEV